MKVALVHDYFTQQGGAERVAQHLAQLLPSAPMYTSVMDAAEVPRGIDRARLCRSPLQRLSGLPLRSLGPLLPSAFAHFDLAGFDTVISSSSAFAHHVRTGGRTAHICYMHTPPAFLWDGDRYFRRNAALGRLATPGLALLRRRDRAAAERVDVLLANSTFTAKRIRRAYGREAEVVYPPIDTDRFVPSVRRSGRYLVVARLRPHKAVDLAIAAANRLGVSLDIVGDGSDRRRLEALAGPTVRFLGRTSDDAVARAMAECTALVVPGVEDFGMVTAEVQAAGRPPVAVAGGGALEIIRDGQTGFLVTAPTVDEICAGMVRAAEEELDSRDLVASARRFDRDIFDARLLAHVGIEVAGAAAAGAIPARPVVPA
jgi:glycosyltransferase involved in cell wall biosynthesis